MGKARWVKTTDIPGRTVKDHIFGMRKAWKSYPKVHIVEIWAWGNKYEILRDKLNGHMGMTIVAKCKTMAEAEVKAREIMKLLS